MARTVPQCHVTPSFCPLKSAYRKSRSTETMLLKIVNDLFQVVDSGHATVLVALNLSAAFDTIDHSVLLRRLSDAFCVYGPAASYIRSHLVNRPRSIVRHLPATPRCRKGLSLARYCFPSSLHRTVSLFPSSASNSAGTPTTRESFRTSGAASS